MASTIATAVAASVETAASAPRQFQGCFDIIPFKLTILDTSVPAGASVVDITVPGAALGDFVFVTCAVDLVEAHMVAFVQSANTVTVCFRSMQEADASTVIGTAKNVTGFILKPKANVFDQVA